MDVFTMVAIVVVAGCASGVINNYFKSRRYQSRSDSDRATLHDELAELRQRVEVLEKIVTDERYDLSRELNRLERHG